MCLERDGVVRNPVGDDEIDPEIKLGPNDEILERSYEADSRPFTELKSKEVPDVADN